MWPSSLLVRRVLSTAVRNPRQVLLVGPDATVAEVKQAYYRLALQYHPDTSTGDNHKENARRFAEIGEAYQQLLREQTTPTSQALTVDTVRDMRDKIDEHIIGSAAVQSSRRFFTNGFFKIVGENFDVVIHRFVEQRDLMSAFETFRLMELMKERPTRSTFEMLIRGCTMAMTPTRDYADADHFTQTLWTTVQELYDRMEKDFKLAPDMWTMHEMIRASGKAGRFDDARYYFDLLCQSAFTLPTKPIYNSMLEACIRTGHLEHCFNVMEEMDEIKTAMWFKYKYRSDAVTVGLLLKASVEGKMLEKIPRVLTLMGKDGLYPDTATANKLLNECVSQGRLDVATTLYDFFKGRHVKIEPELRKALMLNVPTSTSNNNTKSDGD